MDSPSEAITASLTPADAPYVEATRRWVERAVLGLDLCPFAHAPFAQQKIRYAVSHARDSDGLLDDLCGELQSLAAADPDDCETTLLVHPHVFADFFDHNDFLDVAEAAVQTLSLEGVLQVASFHPDYRFADNAPDDAENFGNRSPYPTLHLLREASVERAVDAMSDPESIHRHNTDTLRRLGREGWDRLWDDPAE